MPVYRCPHALALETSALLPYFLDWHKSNRVVWPDGQARIYQPVRLSDAFELLDSLIAKYQDEEYNRK